MKSLYKLLVFLFLIQNVNGQIVNIPDADFKARLIEASPNNTIASTQTSLGQLPTTFHTIDTNGDGEIQVSEASVIKYLNISNSAIVNFQGILSFTNLEYLNCAGNLLGTINVSSLSNLAHLNCSNNNLSTLNVSGLSNLKVLDYSENELGNLNLSSLTNLEELLCSGNFITNLDLSNLTSLKRLVCSNNQLPSININGLTNLIEFNCSDNQLSNLNVNSLTNLEDFNCSHNQLSNLNVNGLTNLVGLNCSYNQLTALDVNGLSNLINLECIVNQLQSIDINGLTHLETINCHHNQLTSLNLNGLTNLVGLNCSYNQLPILNVNSFTNLVTLNCSSNQLPTINTSGLINLVTFNCSINQLTSLNVNGLTNLTSVSCFQNQISTLDFGGLTNLVYMHCGENLLTNIDVNGLVNLIELNCAFNQLTSLDISNLEHLNILNCGFNDLVTLFIKNNRLPSWGNLYFNFNPNLEYICADEGDFSFVQNLVNAFGYDATCTVNDYCSFTPGGTFYTIEGSHKFDMNSNGCDTLDDFIPNFKYNITNGTVNGSLISDETGNYSIPVQAGNHTISPQFENPSYFNVFPPNATISFPAETSPFTQNFCITSNGVHPDVEVVIMPVTVARPGFDAEYKIVYKNKGNQTLSGNVSLTFDDDKTDFVSSNPNPDNLNLNSLTWNYTNLLPFENRVILLTLNVNSPTETPAVNIGDVLHFTTTINPTSGDELPNDNTFNYNQIVVGSFDPNNIECLEGEVVAPSYIGQYLHYAVNFENTGNFPAENIVVKIVIDTTKYDINSLQLMHVSHNSYIRISGNIVEVIFQQINLDSGGHGNLLFKIRTNGNLVEGNSVAKRADIFFDYNAPIDTGMVNTTFQALSNTIFDLDDSIAIYPNPSKNNVNIKCNSTIKSVEFYDVQGRLLQTQLLDEVQTTIDISEKSNGIYFLKITSNKGSKVEKIIKE